MLIISSSLYVLAFVGKHNCSTRFFVHFRCSCGWPCSRVSLRALGSREDLRGVRELCHLRLHRPDGSQHAQSPVLTANAREIQPCIEHERFQCCQMRACGMNKLLTYIKYTNLLLAQIVPRSAQHHTPSLKDELIWRPKVHLFPCRVRVIASCGIHGTQNVICMLR